MTVWLKNLYLYVWCLVTHYHQILFQYTHLKGLFWPENCFFWEFLSFDFYLPNNIESEPNGLILNESGCLFYKRFWTKWYTIWYPVFKNDSSARALSWPSTEIKCEIWNIFSKYLTGGHIYLKFFMNIKDINSWKTFKNQFSSSIPTSFITVFIF